MYDLTAAALENELAQRWSEALELYRQAHAQHPSCDALVQVMARLQQRIGHGDEALQLLQHELRNNPDSMSAQLGLAEYRLRRGDRCGAR